MMVLIASVCACVSVLSVCVSVLRVCANNQSRLCTSSYCIELNSKLRSICQSYFIAKRCQLSQNINEFYDMWEGYKFPS